MVYGNRVSMLYCIDILCLHIEFQCKEIAELPLVKILGLALDRRSTASTVLPIMHPITRLCNSLRQVVHIPLPHSRDTPRGGL